MFRCLQIVVEIDRLASRSSEPQGVKSDTPWTINQRQLANRSDQCAEPFGGRLLMPYMNEIAGKKKGCRDRTILSSSGLLVSISLRS